MFLTCVIVTVDTLSLLAIQFYLSLMSALSAGYCISPYFYLCPHFFWTELIMRLSVNVSYSKNAQNMHFIACVQKASAQAAVYTSVYSVAATMIEHYYLMNSFNQRLTH